jgi:hypothetical protein
MYDMTITGSEFFANGGSTNAQNNDGHAHNIYIGEIRNFTMTGSWSHDSMKGQDVKSRANTTTLLYNRLGIGRDCYK